jgi:hypothetical protein
MIIRSSACRLRSRDPCIYDKPEDAFVSTRVVEAMLVVLVVGFDGCSLLPVVGKPVDLRISLSAYG